MRLWWGVIHVVLINYIASEYLKTKEISSYVRTDVSQIPDREYQTLSFHDDRTNRVTKVRLPLLLHLTFDKHQYLRHLVEGLRLSLSDRTYHSSVSSCSSSRSTC